MSGPIKILHVLSHMARGGAELRTLEILRHIDGQHYRSHVCAISGRAGELDEQVRLLGGEVHLIRRGGIGFSRRFRRLLRQHRFDVVHTHILNYAGLILRLAAQCRVPVRAALFRSSHDGKAANPWRMMYRKLMRRWIDRHATNILAVSEGAMRSVWGPHWKSDPRCQVIYDGLELAAFEEARDARDVRREFDLPNQTPLYIHVGRMAKPKNHTRLLSIFAQVVRRQPEARLLLVGRGGNRVERDVRQRIAELGLNDRVILCRERADVPRLMQAADALIFPSLWEGLPGAVLEACAAGTPVLASDLPGVREIEARFPQVRHLPLDTDDASWAHVLEGISSSADADSSRRACRRSFTGSVFTIDQCAQQHRRVWQGLQPPPARDAA